jgi:hypothetical protein
MRQIEVFAFIFTNDGWILLRSSMWKIQPSKAMPPMTNASKAKRIDIDLQRASCFCEAVSGLIKRVTGSGREALLLDLYSRSQGLEQSLYWLTLFYKLALIVVFWRFCKLNLDRVSA